MNIGQAANRAGITAKMIRHYESIGLISNVRRTKAGYRIYTEGDVHTLKLIQILRGLGYSLPKIKRVLGLWHKQDMDQKTRRSLALRLSADLKIRIQEFEELCTQLHALAVL